MSGIRIEQLDLKSLSNVFLTKDGIFQYITKEKLVEILSNLTDEQLDEIGMSRYLIDRIIQSIQVIQNDDVINVTESNGDTFTIKPTRGYINNNGEEVLVYQHPLTHNANEITTTYDRQFASTAEKEEWNNKVSNTTLQSYINDLNEYDYLLKRQLTKLQKIVEKEAGKDQPTEFSENIASINQGMSRFCSYFDIETRSYVTSYDIVHNFNTTNIQVQVIDSRTNSIVYPTVYVKDANTINITFASNSSETILGDIFRVTIIANYTNSNTLTPNPTYNDSNYINAINAINNNLYGMTETRTLTFNSSGINTFDLGSRTPKYISVYENTPTGLKDITSYTDINYYKDESKNIKEEISINPSILEESMNRASNGNSTHFVVVNTYSPAWENIYDTYVANISNIDAGAALGKDTYTEIKPNPYYQLDNSVDIELEDTKEVIEDTEGTESTDTMDMSFNVSSYFNTIEDAEHEEFLHSIAQISLYDGSKYILVNPDTTFEISNNIYKVNITFNPNYINYKDEGKTKVKARLTLIRRSLFNDSSQMGYIASIYTSTDTIKLNTNYPDEGYIYNSSDFENPTINMNFFGGYYNNLLKVNSKPLDVFNPELFFRDVNNDNYFSYNLYQDGDEHRLKYELFFKPVNPMITNNDSNPSSVKIYSDEDFNITNKVNVIVSDDILSEKIDLVSGLIRQTTEGTGKEIYIGVYEYDSEFYIDVRSIGIYYFENSKTYYRGLGSSFDNFTFTIDDRNPNPIISCEKVNKYFVKVRTIRDNIVHPEGTEFTYANATINFSNNSDKYGVKTDSVKITLLDAENTGKLYPITVDKGQDIKISPNEEVSIFDYLSLIYGDELSNVSMKPLEQIKSFNFHPESSYENSITYDVDNKTIKFTLPEGVELTENTLIGTVYLHYIIEGINSVSFDVYAVPSRTTSPSTENSYNSKFDIVTIEEGEVVPSDSNIVTLATPFYIYLKANNTYDPSSTDDDYGVFGDNFRVELSNNISNNIGIVEPINNLCYKITPFITGNINIYVGNGTTMNKNLTYYVTDEYNKLSNTVPVNIIAGSSSTNILLLDGNKIYNIFDFGNTIKFNFKGLNYSEPFTLKIKPINSSETVDTTVTIDMKNTDLDISLSSYTGIEYIILEAGSSHDITGSLNYTLYFYQPEGN